MSMIDGIGDEVTYFFIIVIVLLIAIAWITTDIHQGLYVRTVYLLEHSRGNHARVQLTNHTESATISEGISETDSTLPEEADSRDSSSGEELPVIEEGPAEIIEVMDASETDSETSLLRRRRLQHFENGNRGGFIEVESENNVVLETIDTETDPEPELINKNEVEIEDIQSLNADSSNITIKLKYINDDLKIVDGKLEEKLGQFKRRHFNDELESNKRVRLIFNGQVLDRDTQTLGNCGMFDNCVVHCLVHQQRVSPSGDTSSTNTENSVSNHINGAQTNNLRDWDMGNLLIVTLSFTLGSAWYFRYQYPQLFTISTTIGLIALTGMLSVISMNMYFPDLLVRMQQRAQ